MAHPILVLGNVRSGRHSLIQALIQAKQPVEQPVALSYEPNNRTRAQFGFEGHTITFEWITNYALEPEDELEALVQRPCVGVVYCIEPGHDRNRWLMVPPMSPARQLVEYVKSFWRANKAWDTLPWLWVITKSDLASAIDDQNWSIWTATAAYLLFGLRWAQLKIA